MCFGYLAASIKVAQRILARVKVLVEVAVVSATNEAALYWIEQVIAITLRVKTNENSMASTRDTLNLLVFVVRNDMVNRRAEDTQLGPSSRATGETRVRCDAGGFAGS